MSLLLFLACTSPTTQDSASDEGGFRAIEVTGSPSNGHVYTVRWESVTDTIGWVEYGADATLGKETWPETEPGRSHAIQLAGEAPGVPTWFRLVQEGPDGRVASELRSWVGTGAGAPYTGLSIDPSMEARPGYRTAVKVGIVPGAVVMDQEGDAVWWTELEDLQVVPLEARLLPGGTEFVYMNLDISGETDACELVRVRLDGEELSRTRCPMGHHDFTVLPDGRAVWLALDVRDVDGEPVVGDQLVVGALDESGEHEVLWSAWDDIPHDLSLNQEPFYEQGYDWSHANSVSVDPASGLLLVSFANLDAVVAVNPADGEVAWQLGGPASTFRIEGGGFVAPHGASMDGADLVLMDNGTGAVGTLSTVARYELDGDVARRVASYTDVPYTSLFLGDVDPAGDGLVVGWGSEGVMEELDASGRVTWRASADLGTVLARVNWDDRLGGPLPQ